MPKSEVFDVGIISAAPISPDRIDFDADQSSKLSVLVGELSSENEALKAEVNRLQGLTDFETIRARLVEPYANKVFSFLVGYCSFVAFLLIVTGTNYNGFQLSDTVLTVIAGSTAVSAIGLVGFVVNGLFKK